MDLLSVLRRELARAGTPERAASARAYMKSAMPFHGVDAVPLSVREALKNVG